MSPVYAQIALDIALRIARGELKENTKVYGRSVMSSEYGVSPETIRRAVRLLEDTGIVEIRQNSGVFILSTENAKKYVARFGEQNHIRTLQQRLEQLLEQQQETARQIAEASRTIVRLNERICQTNPFLNYEITVPPDAPVIGQTLAGLKFWQETGATVIAIRRGEKLILSPGPYAALAEGDTIVYVGDLKSVDAINALFRPETVKPERIR
jgi:K+/H+ antiporter YhaU regulatory subunit KhtT